MRGTTVFEPGSSFSSVINERTVKALAARIKSQYQDFDQQNFLRELKLDGLKFIDRVKLVAEKLEAQLPGDFQTSARILVESLPPEIPEQDAGTTFADHFIVMPMAEYIARRGLTSHDFATSMQTLKAMTKSFSSEVAIRAFLEAFPAETLAYLSACTKDPNVHVRRWASEGTRPRLPQARPLTAFKREPELIMPILEALRDDPHPYVRRSVANSLNDISKDNPAFLVKALGAWQKDASQERLWIMRHSLRTLIKQGHIGALNLLGYKRGRFAIKKLRLTKQVAMGTALEFSFELHNLGGSASIIVDYIIDFQKKHGTAEKVFKLKKCQLAKDETIRLEGKRLLDHFSTRTMYPGRHKLILQVNGQRLAEGTFIVSDD